MIKKVVAYFRKCSFKTVGDLFPGAEHRIVEAFTWKGVRYFMFDDVYKTTTLRAFAAIRYYEELSMRCTREYLTAHYEATKKVLEEPIKGAIQLSQLHIFNEQLGERLRWVVETDSLYKYASVVFFDASESPYDYDEKYNREKIEMWKRDSDIKSFFLQLPITTLLPSFEQQVDYLEAWAEVTRKATKLHLGTLLQVGLSEKTRDDLKSCYGSVEEMPQNLRRLVI